MLLRSIVRELKEMRDGIGNTSRRGVGSRYSQRQTKSYIVADITLTSLEPI
jgi:tubby and related proteins